MTDCWLDKIAQSRTTVVIDERPLMPRTSSWISEEIIDASIAEAAVNTQLPLSESYHRRVLVHSDDAAIVVDPQAGVVYASPAIERVIGISPNQFMGRLAAEFVHPDDVPIVLAKRKEASINGYSGPAEIRGLHGDGTYHWFDAEWWRLAEDNSERVVMHLRAAGERRAAKAALIRSEARLSQLHRSGSDIVIVLGDMDLTATYLGPSVERILGWAPEDFTAEDWSTHIHPDDVSYLTDAITVAGSNGANSSDGEFRIRHLDGRWRWMDFSVQNMSSDPFVEGLVIHAHDVTDRHNAEDELSRLTLTDVLTGLANRTLLLDRIELALDRARLARTQVAVLVCDLDNFKVLNDVLGYRHGDEVLTEFGRRIESIVPRGDTAARTAGDEYAVCLELDLGGHAAITIAEQIRSAIAVPFDFGSGEFQLTMSVGVALATNESVPSTLLRDASAALHRAKAAGRNQVAMFEQETRDSAVHRLGIQAALERAVEENQFVLHFQPAYDVCSGRIVSTEALIRWEHPERGLLGPAHFIGDAESTGQIIQLGAWVAENAARVAANWNFGDVDNRRTMWINASARELNSARYVEHLLETIQGVDLPPDCFGIEITESMLLDTGTSVNEVLRDIHEAGLRIAIDDFGTGYSSLTYLKRFDVDAIKIDQSFVAGLGIHADDFSIVSAITGLGQALDLSVIAEGVETTQQLDLLIEIGCNHVSGFGLCRPQAEGDLVLFLNQALADRRREAEQLEARLELTQQLTNPS